MWFDRWGRPQIVLLLWGTINNLKIRCFYCKFSTKYGVLLCIHQKYGIRFIEMVKTSLG